MIYKYIHEISPGQLSLEETQIYKSVGGNSYVAPDNVTSPDEVELVDGVVVFRPTFDISLVDGVLVNIPEGAEILMFEPEFVRVNMDSSEELDISSLPSNSTIRITYLNYRPFTYETTDFL
jgi:hypothetical protein